MHQTAINELTIIKDCRLNNAMIAHGEGNHGRRDELLTQAYDLNRTIHQLQGHDLSAGTPLAQVLKAHNQG